MKLSSEYVAGLVDGEGCFRIVKPTNTSHYPYGRFMMGFTEKDSFILQSLKKKYGGSIHINKKSGYKDVLIWFLDAQKKLLYFIDDLLPFLILKKDKALEIRSKMLEGGEAI